MIKRGFDMVASCLGLMVLLIPLFLIALWVALDSKGGVFYVQQRVGRHGRLFGLFKFRTMHPSADRSGLLTVGHRDGRITRAGYFLRKYKLDELPQLLNVLKGDMSLVGPRPEVERYVKQYNETQRQVLSVRPGITDWASIQYLEESELLAQASDPEQLYVQEIMPAKLALNLQYLQQASMATDLHILWLTLKKLIFR